MRLNTISEGTWFVISNYLNYNFNKLSVASSKLGGVTLVSFKGTFASEAELKEKQPNPTPGDFAFVIVNNNSAFKIYYTDLNIDWVTDDGIYDPEIILRDYIEMSVLSNVTEDLKKDLEDYNERS